MIKDKIKIPLALTFGLAVTPVQAEPNKDVIILPQHAITIDTIDLGADQDVSVIVTPNSIEGVDDTIEENFLSGGFDLIAAGETRGLVSGEIIDSLPKFTDNSMPLITETMSMSYELSLAQTEPGVMGTFQSLPNDPDLDGSITINEDYFRYLRDHGLPLTPSVFIGTLAHEIEHLAQSQRLSGLDLDSLDETDSLEVFLAQELQAYLVGEEINFSLVSPYIDYSDTAAVNMRFQEYVNEWPSDVYHCKFLAIDQNYGESSLPDNFYERLSGYSNNQLRTLFNENAQSIIKQSMAEIPSPIECALILNAGINGEYNLTGKAMEEIHSIIDSTDERLFLMRTGPNLGSN